MYFLCNVIYTLTEIKPNVFLSEVLENQKERVATYELEVS